MKKILITLAALAVIAIAPAAFAGSATGNLPISATVNANCTITTTAVAFGTYDPLAAGALNATGGVTVTCVKGSNPNVDLGLGSHSVGINRFMQGGPSAESLQYQLFQPPDNTPGTACTFPGTTVWGTTAGGSAFALTAAANKNARSYNVCGTIGPGQDISAGAPNYTDSVVATVNF